MCCTAVALALRPSLLAIIAILAFVQLVLLLPQRFHITVQLAVVHLLPYECTCIAPQDVQLLRQHLHAANMHTYICGRLVALCFE